MRPGLPDRKYGCEIARMNLYRWQRLNWVVYCAGVEDWQLGAVHCVQNPRYSNKLKGQSFVHFQEIQYTLEMRIPDNRRIIEMESNEVFV